MALSLVVGPANAGKVALLLERYAAAADRDPFLIVPTRSDVARVECELLRDGGCLLGGTIGTFDDLFRRIARGGGARPVVGDLQRELLLRRATSTASLNGLSASARSPGFVEALGEAIAELQAALIPHEEVGGDLARLYCSYRAELEGFGLWDRDGQRLHAVERLRGDLNAWQGQPVLAYGFEDLTAAEWGLLDALAGRAEVTVSLPYEPGRPAFAALASTAEDLSTLAAGRIEELPAAFNEVAHPAIAHLERALFADRPPPAPPLEGGVRFFEGAGTRGVLELVGEEILSLVRAGTPPDRMGVVCPSLERVRGPIETAFATLGIPHVVEAPVRLGQTAWGQALLGLLRFAWLGGGRRDLFSFLRSPYSGLARSSADYVEGRLRGRAVESPERVESETVALRGARLPVLDALRAEGSPLAAAREAAVVLLRAAHGLERPPVGEAPRQDLEAFETCRRALEELAGWENLEGVAGREDVVATLERATVWPRSAGEPGRVPVVDLLRARTRRFDVVFVLGLEEGILPRRAPGSPFLDEDTRRRLGGRLQRPDQLARERYLFYTVCSRATRRLYLVREAAGDDGAPREPSPFWEEATAVYEADDVARWTRRRPLSALTWPLETAPSDRERLRAVATLAADAETESVAEALARANGWERRLERARTAFRRRTALRHPLVLEQLRARATFNVTELERFADCSSAWLFERFVGPRSIDAEVDPKLRGSVAHTTLNRFFSGLPKELGADHVDERNVEDAVRFLRRCLDDSLGGVRMDLTDVQRRQLDGGLWRDLEAFVRDEAAAELGLVPRHFEVSFGSERSSPALQRGLDLGGVVLSGKIDRIDVDPFSARGIVHDYKSGKHAPSAREIERELRLQIPLYMLVLRDLVGIEPLGGLYRPLAGDRKARGLLREDARGDLPGFVRNDYLDDEAFWGQVEQAGETARTLAGRIRAGDVRHDPRGGECPAWCDLWRMCRVSRA
ncbi:MAG: PD-(D/E)XK nuclease family protein [Gaiellaceae bacterium]